MSKLGKEALQSNRLEVVADRGYFRGEEVLACDEDNIITYLPKPLTSGNRKKGLYTKRDFKYHANDNEFECPAGERLIWRFRTQEKGQTNDKYWSSNRPSCEQRHICTPSKHRRITRWEHEACIDAMESKLDHEPERMRVRRSTVEHPFGTLKNWIGYAHSSMKELKNVKTEMGLHVLAYNLKRAMKIIGVRQLIEAM